MLRPSTRISPSGASHKRAIIAARVVLPDPVGPTIANVEPAGILRLIFFNTGLATLAEVPFDPECMLAVGYVKVRLRNSISPETGAPLGNLAKRSSICGAACSM